ncbi:MAG: hypothetical protein EOM10_15035, partial [Opitutae bacterium]|nr:hypothetical protein [Opitutae bacterium]
MDGRRPAAGLRRRGLRGLVGGHPRSGPDGMEFAGRTAGFDARFRRDFSLFLPAHAAAFLAGGVLLASKARSPLPPAGRVGVRRGRGAVSVLRFLIGPRPGKGWRGRALRRRWSVSNPICFCRCAGPSITGILIQQWCSVWVHNWFSKPPRCSMNKLSRIVVLANLIGLLAAVSSYAVPNPAAAYAAKLGYVYAPNETGGTVTTPDGTVLDAWDFFRGKVGSEYAYGAQFGYDTVNRRVETNGYVQSFAVCVPKDPMRKSTPEEISLLDLMRQNGEPLWDSTRGSTPPLTEKILKTAPLKTFPKQELPSSYDSRNVGGLSYIGPVRNQGNCGSCYSFGAAAAAEGSFNVAMNRTGSQCVDFSEAYIAWCLGTYGAYSDHFSGCDGADYEYAELKALTVEGICGENQMPYNNGSDPG